MPPDSDQINLYVDLLRDSLLGVLQEDPPMRSWGPNKDTLEFHLATRLEGRDWPSSALTMVGAARLNNLADTIISVVDDDIPGDLIETGVWRGGAAIFMRGLLKFLGDLERQVYVADSFRGLPAADEKYPADAGLRWDLEKDLAVSLDTVTANFDRYGLLDRQVVFLEGWFKDTLPSAPIDALALMRLDGDMYESTHTALTHLYPKLSPGGYVVVDDFGAVPACRQAVEDFRAQKGIEDPIEEIDWTGVYWRRES